MRAVDRVPGPRALARRAPASQGLDGVPLPWDAEGLRRGRVGFSRRRAWAAEGCGSVWTHKSWKAPRDAGLDGLQAPRPQWATRSVSEEVRGAGWCDVTSSVKARSQDGRGVREASARDTLRSAEAAE